MTPGELVQHLCEEIDEEVGARLLGQDAPLLTVPQLMHIKIGLDRALLDAIGDEKTPCPHDSNRNWIAQGGYELCGQCGRRTGKVREENERMAI